MIGVRNMLKALLKALLEPIDRLRAAEQAGDYTARLALLEEAKTLPFGAVWDHYCESLRRAGGRRRGWPRSAATSGTCCRRRQVKGPDER